MTGSTISGNVAPADRNGGGIVSFGITSLTNTRFTNNTARYGAGLFVADGSATLSGVRFEANTAGHSGGGLIVADGSVTLSNVHFEANGEITITEDEIIAAIEAIEIVPPVVR